MPEPMETVEESSQDGKSTQGRSTPTRRDSGISKVSSAGSRSSAKDETNSSTSGSTGKPLSRKESELSDKVSPAGSANGHLTEENGADDERNSDEVKDFTANENDDNEKGEIHKENDDGDNKSKTEEEEKKDANAKRNHDGGRSPSNHDSSAPAEENEAERVPENGTSVNSLRGLEDQQLEHFNDESRSSSRSSTASPGVPRDRFKVTLLYPLEKQYSCPACQDVFRYPIKLDDCEHRVCAACFYDIQRVEPRCPIDQNRISRNKCKLDMEFNKEIQALEVKCNSHEWGCKWEGQLKDVQAHNETCDYADALCINDCGVKFQRRFLQKHLEKDCPKKIIPCPFCDERHLREDKKAHLEDCINVPLPCPNKCDKKLQIPRNKIDQHIEEECPRTKIMCQYEEIGCAYRASREKLPKHYKSGIVDHMAFVYNFMMEQAKRIDHHDNQLQDHLNVLENHQQRLGDLERLSRNQLIWRIEDYTRKAKEAKSGNATTLFSPTFTTSKHGYRLAASICLNGDGKGKGTHVSVFVSILRGAFDSLLKWPFDYRVTFFLLDQNDNINDRKHIKFSIKPNPCPENEPFLGKPVMEKNASFGGAKFAKQEEVHTREYVKNDAIFIKVVVDCDGSTEP